MRLLWQPVLVENVTGAGGSIGVTRAVRSAPDGYTISFGHSCTMCSTPPYCSTFNLLTELQPRPDVAENPMVIVSKNDLSAKTLMEFIAWGVSRTPAKVSAGTAGAGSGSHIGGVI